MSWSQSRSMPFAKNYLTGAGARVFSRWRGQVQPQLSVCCLCVPYCACCTDGFCAWWSSCGMLLQSHPFAPSWHVVLRVLERCVPGVWGGGGRRPHSSQFLADCSFLTSRAFLLSSSPYLSFSLCPRLPCRATTCRTDGCLPKERLGVALLKRLLR